MTRRGLATLAALLAGAALAAAPARAGGRLSGGARAIARDVSAPGALLSGGSLSLNATVGEPSGPQTAGAGVQLTPGYMTLAAQPGSVVSLSAVTKATGTLDLAWTAPGVDGFQGDVVAGYYRVDYSSDPAHVFAPTVYQTEFSTTVTAGSAQELELSGLLPNTTYFAKVYLADARKAFAEDSHRDDDSTLANAPDPSFSAVYACSATVTWPLPSGGSEGFGTAYSTTNFVSGSTTTGSTGLLTLSLSGLSPGTSYYLKIASLNWQGDKNYSTIIATVTPSGTCVPAVFGLAVSGNAAARTARLSWSNPSAPAPQEIIVLMSTNTTESLTDGQAVAAGQTLPDGAKVKAAASAASLADSGLSLDTTYFYHVFTQYSGPAYSVAVSTALFLDLPPMTPAGVAAVVNAGRTTATLSWHSVGSNDDGSAFKAPASPLTPELAYYRIDRSTSTASPYWVSVTTVSASSVSYADAISGLGSLLYRVVAVDSLGNQSPSVAVDPDAGDAYLFAADQVTHIKFSSDLYAQVRNSSAFGGTDTVLRLSQAAPSDKAISAIRVDAVPAVGSQSSIPLRLDKPEVQVVMSYGAGAASTLTTLQAKPADSAYNSYSVYWNNGSGFVNLYGQVDAPSQTVSVNTAMTGTYELRSLARPQSFDFDLSGRTNRIITPNGDGLNDAASFIYDNPRDSAVSGKIYDVSGGYVSDMQACPSSPSTCIQWDGKAGGRVVSGGVYVYQIRAEDKSFSGTIVVIR